MGEFLANLDIYIVSGLLILGSSLMLLAAVGLVRLPDLPTRMHASTKAGTLGAALTIFAVAVFIPEPAVIARSLAVIVFLILTAPVAAHVIGRAGYFVGVPLWEGTVKDDLAAQYDFETHILHSETRSVTDTEMTEDSEVEEKSDDVPEPESIDAAEEDSEVEEDSAGEEEEVEDDTEIEQDSDAEEKEEVEEVEEVEEDLEGKKKMTLQ